VTARGRRSRWALLALLVLAAVPTPAQQVRLAARVNGVGIGRERLDRYFEEYLAAKGRSVGAIRSPGAYGQLMREALDVLVEGELLAQEAARRGLGPEPGAVEKAVAEARSQFPTGEKFRSRLERSGLDEAGFAEHVGKQMAIERLLEQIGSGVEVSDAEVHAFYEDNLWKFTVPEQVRARHVLIGVAPGASQAERDRARARIEAVLEEARAGADFAELARRHSTDTSATAGGELGFFARGQMVGPFEAAAFALQPGQLSGVVETQFGFHVIQVEERRGGERAPESAARDDIRAHLKRAKSQAALRDRIEALREAGHVEILLPGASP